MVQPGSVLRSYLPALVFAGLGTAIGLLFVSISSRIGPDGRRRAASRETPYESGMASAVPTSFRFGISFYLIAMLFILFDIEVIFLYPVAVELRAYGTFALVETAVFIFLLFIAFAYVWRRGALNWR